MARLTKAQVAHLNNLSKASSTSHKATVEKVPESEDENDADFIPAPHSKPEELCDRFFVLEDDPGSEFDTDDDMTDLESVSGSDLEEKELDEEEEEEVSDDVALLTFTNVLRRAQEIAVEAEREKFKSGQQKWKMGYKGNSDCNMRRFRQQCHLFKSSGQKFISKWFPIQEKAPQETSSKSSRETSESVGDSIF